MIIPIDFIDICFCNFTSNYKFILDWEVSLL